MSFSTPNSSFIFDRRRRSIRLCAVLRAIFRPCALVPPLLPRPFLPAAAPLLEGSSAAAAAAASGCACWLPFGFIWIIFLERVGGGGSANASSFLVARDCDCDAEDCLRWTLTGDVGDAGRYDESEPWAEGGVEEAVRSL